MEKKIQAKANTSLRTKAKKAQSKDSKQFSDDVTKLREFATSLGIHVLIGVFTKNGKVCYNVEGSRGDTMLAISTLADQLARETR